MELPKEEEEPPNESVFFANILACLMGFKNFITPPRPLEITLNDVDPIVHAG